MVVCLEIGWKLLLGRANNLADFNKRLVVGDAVDGQSWQASCIWSSYFRPIDVAIQISCSTAWCVGVSTADCFGDAAAVNCTPADSCNGSGGDGGGGDSSRTNTCDQPTKRLPDGNVTPQLGIHKETGESNRSFKKDECVCV